MKNIIWLIIAIAIFIIFCLLRLFEISIFKYEIIVLEALFDLFLIFYILSDIKNLIARHCPNQSSLPFPPSQGGKHIEKYKDDINNDISSFEIIKTVFKHFILISCIVVLHIYVEFLFQILPLYNPHDRHILIEKIERKEQGIPIEEIGRKEQATVRLKLGDFKGNDRKEIDSTIVGVSVYIDNLHGIGDGFIAWGENDDWEKFRVMNGVNYLKHEFKSRGIKKIRLKLNDEFGKQIKIIDNDNILKEIIGKEINIVGDKK